MLDRRELPTRLRFAAEIERRLPQGRRRWLL